MQIGKYRLIHKLATGGMAEVFLAKAAGPMGFEKLLVVKRILPHLATEPTFVEMFLTEARLAAQLNHPNIVQIFDFGEAERTYFLAMEYIDGPNLREIIKRSSGLGLVLPLAFCARVVAAACEGLAFAHDFRDPITRQPVNVIHRDISPDNILLSRQGAVKVVDFGIAKAAGVSPHTQTGVLKGKLAYMSPEHLRNEPLDRRADVYALGVVFYELLTGLKPFIATSDAGMVQAVLFEMQVPILQRRPDVPEALQRILARALAKERENRYLDCASFQADLEEFIVSTAKPMGATQIAQIVSMMTVGVENPYPIVQTVSSSPSNPKLLQPQLALETTAPSPERTPIGLATSMPFKQHESGEVHRGELTMAARPSKLILQNGVSVPQVSSSSSDSPPEPHPPKSLGPREKDLSWVAAVGVLLFLAGGGILIQQHFVLPGGDSKPPPSRVLEVERPPPESVRDGGVDLVDAGVEQVDAGTPQGTDGGSPDAGSLPHPRRATSDGGALELRVRPEAMLFLDSWQMGVMRRKRIPLEPGQYTLRLVNAKLRKEVHRKITIHPRKTTRIEINLLSEK